MKTEPRIDTNEHELHPFLEKLLDGAEVEWMALGKVGEYAKERITSETLNEENYVGVENLL